ncbi:MAG: phospholipase D-like domain-containing protein [Propionibacteriaceae bacterium]|jgi:hypothetical protein|nr:phospholipase D-like domain-containing protein [Propionibacteriaceae bacterium]
MRLRRIGVLSLASLVTGSLLNFLPATEAGAISFDTDPSTGLAKTVTKDSCPTLTETPRYFEVFWNTDDMESRGYLDAKNNSPWSFANRIAQIICGAKARSHIYIGMYFVRAIGTSERPESDSEVIWKAMEYVHKYRKVSIGMVMDKGSITPASAKKLIRKRLKGIASLYWCSKGCFNTNTYNGLTNPTNPTWDEDLQKYLTISDVSINHEKFMVMTNTRWEKDGKTHPLVYSSSGQFARSQFRGYTQEASVIYDDKQMAKLFTDRYMNMKTCATSASKCRAGKFSATAYKKDTLVKQRGIWVDSVYKHPTDAGRGTTVSFSPQPQKASEFYIQQFGNVDCSVDNKIRVAMYRLTDSRAVQFVRQMVRLKRAGCDVQVLLSQQGGAQTISKEVARLFKKANMTSRIRCTALPTHTKLVLITPADSSAGRVLFGTSNMTTWGLRYSEEHTITIDSRKATGQYAEDIKRVVAQYEAGWNELSLGSKVCK